MASFISAGHNIAGLRVDPGAVANGLREADLTAEFRNLVAKEAAKLGVRVITDKDNETLAQYLTRIQTGNGSIVIEYHFDAASPSATGATGFFEKDADRLDKAFAKEITDSVANVLGIRNRGVHSEEKTHRKSLGLMREEGIICLVELGFITNLNDIKAYQANKLKLAKEHAKIIKRYDDLI
jgi:N-acetylmuramoyl-L-alanine amidase